MIVAGRRVMFRAEKAEAVLATYNNPPIVEVGVDLSLSNGARPEGLATALGWQVPPAERIPVALAGLRDADWSLEADETRF
jgi:hypothetical protein